IPIHHIGHPHRLTQPDAYQGIYIPQGFLVFWNIWAIMCDPGLYQDPKVFEPGRWLTHDKIVGVEERKDVDADADREKEEAGKERDPRAFVFGFG
ncbi:hypothetical protein P692DRAFT_20758518, partial [Suillus brevipes Sb2]